jgi:hypothetical protein
VEYCLRAAPAVLKRRGVVAQSAVTVNVSGGGTWTIDGRSGEWGLSDQPCDVEVSIEPEELVLGVTGRRGLLEDRSFAVEIEAIFGGWRMFASP